jgi:hypothetical protein
VIGSSQLFTSNSKQTNKNTFIHISIQKNFFFHLYNQKKTQIKS